MNAGLIARAGVRGVFFDLVGTLIRPRGSVGEQYAAWARRFGAPDADPGRLGEAFRRAMQDGPPMTFPGLSLAETAARERTWWHTLVARVVSEAGLASRLGGARFDEFFDALFAHFTTADAWAPYPDAGRALERLRDGGVAVGLVTNYDTRVHRVLDAVGLAPLLESVTIPAESGAAKPDPAIFHHALRRQGLQAGEAAHVGDEPGDDYSGAVGAGMLPILLDREDRHRVSGLRRIRSLDEL